MWQMDSEMRLNTSYILACVLLWAIAPTGVAAQEGGGAESSDVVLVRINGDHITAERFTKTYLSYLLATGRNDALEERRHHLTNLVATYVLADEARSRGYDEDPAFAQYVDVQRKLAVGGRYFDVAMVDSLRPPSGEETRSVYSATKSEVELRHLYFRDRARADAAHERLEAGEDFIDLANETFDTAGYDSLAGYLGWASYWDLDAAIAEAAFELPVGSYSEPVRSRQGWHVLWVDDRSTSPLLTEDEFARHRASIAGREEIRRHRLAGDRLVRAIMNEVEIDIDREAARQIAEAVRRVIGDDEGGGADADPSRDALRRLEDEEIEAMRAEFTPETVVASYRLDGEVHELTAGMFFQWMPELPFDELRLRPMAALGRSLRNEVLARKGNQAGLEDDPLVTETVQHLANTYLAHELRDRLRTEAAVEPTDDEIRRAYETLGYRELRAVEADYWRIRFDSYADAQAALDEIRAGSVAPEELDGYEFAEGRDVRDHELGGYIRRAPLETPVVVCTQGSACSVLRVADREQIYASFDELKDQIAEDLRTHLPEVKLLDSLRQEVRVDVDEELFERMWRRTTETADTRRNGTPAMPDGTDD